VRKNVGFVLLALGAALLAVGVVTTTWAPGVVKKTPLDVDTRTYLEGTAARLGAEPRPIRIMNQSRVDSDKSNDERAAFVQVQCVVFTDQGETADCPGGEDPDVVSITDDRFVTDRVTALSLPEDGIIDPELVAAAHEGVVNKFPFDTAPEEYPYWDGLTAQAWPAAYVGEEEVAGLDTYHFQVTIDDQPAEVAPATDEGPATQGTYSNRIDLWIEPETGAIIDQRQDQQRYVGETEVLDLQAEFTDDQVQTFADEARDNIDRLHLVTRTAPLVGFIGGGVLFVAGLVLVLTGRRREPGAGEPRRSTRREPVPV
jgi:hypothetical protein